ncbi:AFT1 [[Candida] subhashii]|uniref:AFT1 n=1 Tax=[Candida] subhashii TaxID=561895 RepID=A0A8J5UH22_9ASCO|nr:AFT1 [[Candida] subhashii]KAG7662868.1 AFT1 [[Candida] subhashii]
MTETTTSTTTNVPIRRLCRVSLSDLDLENRKFTNKEDIKPWLSDCLIHKKGIEIVIERSDTGKIIFRCKNKEKKAAIVSESSSSKSTTNGNNKQPIRRQTTCPFKIRANYGIRDKVWTLSIINDNHDHQVNCDSQSLSSLGDESRLRNVSVMSSNGQQQKEQRRIESSAALKKSKTKTNKGSNIEPNLDQSSASDQNSSKGSDLFNRLVESSTSISDTTTPTVITPTREEQDFFEDKMPVYPLPPPTKTSTPMNNNFSTPIQPLPQPQQKRKRTKKTATTAGEPGGGAGKIKKPKLIPNPTTTKRKPAVSKKDKPKPKTKTESTVSKKSQSKQQQHQIQLPPPDQGSMIYNNNMNNLSGGGLLTSGSDLLLQLRNEVNEKINAIVLSNSQSPERGFLMDSFVLQLILDHMDFLSPRFIYRLRQRLQEFDDKGKLGVSQEQNIEEGDEVEEEEDEVVGNQRIASQQEDASRRRVSDGLAISQLRQQQQHHHDQHELHHHHHQHQHQHQQQQQQQEQQDQVVQEQKKSILNSWLNGPSTANTLSGNQSANLIPLSPLLNDSDNEYTTGGPLPPTNNGINSSTIDNLTHLPGINLSSNAQSFGSYIVPSNQISIQNQNQQLPPFNSIQNKLSLSPTTGSGNPQSNNNNSTSQSQAAAVNAAAAVAAASNMLGSSSHISLSSSTSLMPPLSNSNTTLNPSHLLKNSSNNNNNNNNNKANLILGNLGDKYSGTNNLLNELKLSSQFSTGSNQQQQQQQQPTPPSQLQLNNISFMPGFSLGGQGGLLGSSGSNSTGGIGGSSSGGLGGGLFRDSNLGGSGGSHLLGGIGGGGSGSGGGGGGGGSGVSGGSNNLPTSSILNNMSSFNDSGW